MHLVPAHCRYLEVQCVAGLRKLHDPKLALAAKLTSQDGDDCVGKTAQAHADLRDTVATNDTLAEGTFGLYKSVRRSCPGLGMQKAAAISQTLISKHLGGADAVRHRIRKVGTNAEQRLGIRKSKPPPSGLGYFHTLPHLEQKALIDMARLTRKEARSRDCADEKEVCRPPMHSSCHAAHVCTWYHSSPTCNCT